MSDGDKIAEVLDMFCLGIAWIVNDGLMCIPCLEEVRLYFCILSSSFYEAMCVKIILEVLFSKSEAKFCKVTQGLMRWTGSAYFACY